MTEIRKYKPEDYMAIQRREFDLVTFLNFPKPQEIAENLANGVAFTGLVDGEMTLGTRLFSWSAVRGDLFNLEQIDKNFLFNL